MESRLLLPLNAVFIPITIKGFLLIQILSESVLIMLGTSSISLVPRNVLVEGISTWILAIELSNDLTHENKTMKTQQLRLSTKQVDFSCTSPASSLLSEIISLVQM